MREITQSRAQTNNWHCTIEGLEGVAFQLYDFDVPMITMGTTELGNLSDLQLSLPGDHIDIDEIQINFFVEENWKNYIECFKWLRGNANMNNGLLRDITISPLNNMKEFQGIAFVYKGCFPINMAPVPLDASNGGTDIVMALSLKVQDMDIIEDWVGTEV